MNLARVPYDPRRLEALVAYAEAHRPSPYASAPVRRILTSLAPAEGVVEVRADGRTVMVAAVVDRCENVHDAAMFDILGIDEDAPLGPLLDVATPAAVAVARAARRRAVALQLPADRTDAPSLAANGWAASVGSYVLARDGAPSPSPPLPDGAAWGDLTPGEVAAHYALVRAAFADDPGMVLPDLAHFAPAALAADPPVRVLRAGRAHLGFARGTLQDGGRTGYVATIGRDPAARGRGLGPVVLAEALRLLAARGAKGFRLGVTADNRSAIALYRAFGFREVEAWTGWLRPVEAA